MDIIISDMHLSGNHPEISHLLEQFTESLPSHVNRIFILGDIFDYWVGGDIDLEYASSVKKLFNGMAKKCKSLYIMRGNRDFLLTDKEIIEFGAHPIKDPYPIEHLNENVLLTHGDRLCTDDQWFMIYLFFTRVGFLRRLFLSLPRQFRLRFAKDFRQKSKSRQKRIPKVYADINKRSAVRFVKRYQCNTLIHGHTHRPQEDYLDNRQQFKRHVLGTWSRTLGHYLVLDENGIAQRCFPSTD